MTDPSRTVTITLGKTGLNCSVVLDGIDVSHYCRAITVRASVHEITRVHLDLIAGVEIVGEAGEVLRGLPDTPAVTVEAIEVRPGDLVVARVEGLVSEAVRHALDGQLGRIFPHNRIAVLGAGVGLSVWRGADLPRPEGSGSEGGLSPDPGAPGSQGGV